MSNNRKSVENHLHIKDWPEGDRPREMLLDKGQEALSDAALLAILLRTGRQGQNAIALAREMISKFGGLNGLISATQEDLLGVKGIGKAHALLFAQEDAKVVIADILKNEGMALAEQIKKDYALIEIFAMGSADNIAHSAHLLGFVAGVVLAMREGKEEWPPKPKMSMMMSVLVPLVIALIVAIASGVYYNITGV